MRLFNLFMFYILGIIIGVILCKYWGINIIEIPEIAIIFLLLWGCVLEDITD